MNTIPMLRGQQVRNNGCGRQALINVERAFWQSRMTKNGQRAEPIEVVDLRELARKLRRPQ